MSSRGDGMGVRLRVTLVVVGVCVLAAGALAPTHAQSGKAVTKSGRTDQENRGEAIFVQRCSVCHLPKLEDAQGRPAVRPFKSFGPDLKGLLTKDVDTDQVTAVRQFILNGTDRMPGFQYSLKPNEIDDIVAFLKTF